MKIEPDDPGALTPDVITRITRMNDPVLRNLRITQTYHDLSRAIARFTGPEANWCTFATWASKQAGQTIRREDLLRAFEKRFRISPEIGDLVQQLITRLAGPWTRDEAPVLRDRMLRALNPGLALARASDAVARGNLKVFAELAPLFVRFLDEVAQSSEAHDGALERFCSELRPGDPPEGQTLLAQAFTALHKSFVDSGTRPQFLFFANLLTGFHEQTRLQPEINEALNASLGDRDELRKRLLEVVYPGSVLRLRARVARWLQGSLPLDAVLNQFIDAAQRCVREIITRCLMTLHLAGGDVLRLGRDLPAKTFPAALQTISNNELRAFLVRVDPTPGSLADSGARDWADLDDRMHFITDYFRCYHDDTGLHGSPFSAEQLLELEAGRLPRPPL
ncbi:MAG TPA: hypothetical protein VGA56_06050 [Opitutaceae bacterium]